MMEQMALDEKERQPEEEQPESEEDEEGDEEAKVQPSTSMDEDGLPESFCMDDYDNEDDSAAIRDFMEGDDEDNDDQDSAEMDAALEHLETQEDEDNQVYDEADMEIRPTDGVVLVATTEEEFSSLEMHIYDEEDGNLYVHHEIALPAFPLCLSWMNCPPRPATAETPAQVGNYVAVGTFKPAIEIWDLDVLDVLEPCAVLGGEVESNLRTVASNASSRKLRPGSHADAVMCLDWNSEHRNMLLSGSADHTVKIWDITTQSCMHTLMHHSDKVQCAVWNPVESTIFATGGFDHDVAVVDGRAPHAVAKFTLPADVETLCWNTSRPHELFVGTESGLVLAFDVRESGKSEPLFVLEAHTKSIASVSCSSSVPGLCATASADKTVRLWDVQSGTPQVVATKEMAVGELFSMSFYADMPYTLAVGGSKGTFALWDTSENANVEATFGHRVATGAAEIAFALSTQKSPDEIAQELLAEEDLVKVTKSKKKKKKSKSNK